MNPAAPVTTHRMVFPRQNCNKLPEAVATPSGEAGRNLKSQNPKFKQEVSHAGVRLFGFQFGIWCLEFGAFLNGALVLLAETIAAVKFADSCAFRAWDT
jgi:hypothetical protein